VKGILPGTACEPKMTTVGSQDTTGPMTADELKELACLEFQTDLFMQSFCHTAAYPKPADVKMHQNLPKFVIARRASPSSRGMGSSIPGLTGSFCGYFRNRWRFPYAVSDRTELPAGSGLVAFAGALGFMPLDMPESVLVRFKGTRQPASPSATS